MNNTLFLDIETFGSKPEFVEPTLPTAADVKVGNLKDEVKIAAKIAESLPVMIAEAIAKAHEENDKEWRSNALKSVKGKVISLSYAMNDEPVVNLVVDSSEKELELLLQFEEFLKSIAPLHQQTFVVAHNGLAFDFPWLRHRAMKYRLQHLFELLNFSKYDPRARDTMDMFRGTDYRNYYSMDGIAQFFGVEGKTDMKGSEVHDAFLAEEYEKIAEYCGHDVEVLRNIYKLITKLEV